MSKKVIWIILILLLGSLAAVAITYKASCIIAGKECPSCPTEILKEVFTRNNSSEVETSAHLPASFTNLEYEAALARSIDEKKLLIVDLMAEWCGPCKKMDRTTWVDESVVEWLSANAIAIQVNVDHRSDLAKKFEAHSIPKMVVLREGEVIGQRVGGTDVTELLEWLNGLEK